MKKSFVFNAEELTDLIASVLSTNGHDAIGGLVFYKNGEPVEFDEARIDVGASLTVRCVPEQSHYDKMRARYFESIGQMQPQPQEIIANAGQSEEDS